jgi:hypothetical protein
MKKSKVTPLFAIGYLSDMHKYYKEEMINKDSWENADILYRELLKAYHVYCGIKKDYRKDYK